MFLSEYVYVPMLRELETTPRTRDQRIRAHLLKFRLHCLNLSYATEGALLYTVRIKTCWLGIFYMERVCYVIITNFWRSNSVKNLVYEASNISSLAIWRSQGDTQSLEKYRAKQRDHPCVSVSFAFKWGAFFKNKINSF